jgi:hypothetical protein
MRPVTVRADFSSDSETSPLQLPVSPADFTVNFAEMDPVGRRR